MNGQTVGDLDTNGFLDTAGRLAACICRDAVWDANACTWLGWTSEPGVEREEVVFATIGADLYGGTAGVALFLAAYWKACPSDQIGIVLRGAARQALAGLSRLPVTATGLFNGAAGICLAAIEAGQALDDQGLVAHGLDHLTAVAEVEPTSAALDVIDGSAGLIPVLLDVGTRFSREPLVDSAVRHGDHLLANAQRAAEGWSWPTMPRVTHRNATGYAHGAAGIAAALLELYCRTGEGRFLRGAEEGWRYERSHFCHQQGNWPDFRYPPAGDAGPHAEPPRCSLAWCHGAPGIGMARLRAWELGQRDAWLAAEIDAALVATGRWLEQAPGPGTNYSLCHGLAGNAELLLRASCVLDRPELYAAAADVGRRGIAEHLTRNQPWPCGGTPAGETPNLMLGLAGIGLFYLRLHAPRADADTAADPTASELLIAPFADAPFADAPFADAPLNGAAGR